MASSTNSLDQSSGVVPVLLPDDPPEPNDSTNALMLWENWGIVAVKISLVAISIISSIAIGGAIGYFSLSLLDLETIGCFVGTTSIGVAAGLVGGTVYVTLSGESKKMFRKTDANLDDCRNYLLSIASWSATALVIGMVTAAVLSFFAITAPAAKTAYEKISFIRALRCTR